MQKLNYNSIAKKDFIKLKEENIMFITNPGRMGDEDGITFVVNQRKKYKIYRVDGWMYPKKDIHEKELITLADASKQFPKWREAWQNGDNEKYKHLYMGFGNGLNIDNFIYKEFKPYLNKLVEKYLTNRKKGEREEQKYAAIFNVWEEALIKMMEEKDSILE